MESEQQLRTALIAILEDTNGKAFPLLAWIDKRIGGEVETYRDGSSYSVRLKGSVQEAEPLSGGSHGEHRHHVPPLPTEHPQTIKQKEMQKHLDTLPAEMTMDEEELREELFNMLKIRKAEDGAVSLSDVGQNPDVKPKMIKVIGSRGPTRTITLKEWIRARIGEEIVLWHDPDILGDSLMISLPGQFTERIGRARGKGKPHGDELKDKGKGHMAKEKGKGKGKDKDKDRDRDKAAESRRYPWRSRSRSLPRDRSPIRPRHRNSRSISRRYRDGSRGASRDGRKKLGMQSQGFRTSRSRSRLAIKRNVPWGPSGRPPNEGLHESLRIDQKKRDGDWTCFRCENHNYASRRVCNTTNCGEPRPGN